MLAPVLQPMLRYSARSFMLGVSVSWSSKLFPIAELQCHGTTVFCDWPAATALLLSGGSLAALLLIVDAQTPRLDAEVRALLAAASVLEPGLRRGRRAWRQGTPRGAATQEHR